MRQFGDGVPSHAHWIPTDTTETPGKWIPRRQNWRNYLVTRDAQDVTPELSAVIDDLQQVHLSSDSVDFALERVPMGLWADACSSTPDAQASPTTKQLLDDLPNHPDSPLTRWLSGDVFGGSSPGPGQHIHFQSRGEGVFRAICQNCHGQQIDSKSALAATIQELTGGATRVANFTAGLFGPLSAPGAFAHDEFLLGDGLPSQDWQARYVLFMGLGGTGANIPLSVLNLVATSPFYGRAVKVPGANSPNMLGSAQQLCFFVLSDPRHLEASGPTFDSSETNFVPGVGHYDLWESLCTFGNEPVVHVFAAGPSEPGFDPSKLYRVKDDAGLWIYSPDTPVGNQQGKVETGIQPTNLWPWCVQRPASKDEQGWLDAWATTNQIDENALPFCPDAIFASIDGAPVYKLALDSTARAADSSVPFSNADFTLHWLRRGAFNAGLSAFSFMRGFAEHTTIPDKPFDFCVQ